MTRSPAALLALLCCALCACDSSPSTVSVTGPQRSYAFTLPERFSVAAPSDGAASAQGRDVTYSDGESLVIVTSSDRARPAGWSELDLDGHRDAVLAQLGRDVPEFALAGAPRPMSFGGQPGYALVASGVVEARASIYYVGLTCDARRCYQLTTWAPREGEARARSLFRDVVATWRVPPAEGGD